MSIKGIYGIRKIGRDKVSYNRYGSQPDGLGRDMLSFCRDHSEEEIGKMFDGIRIVDCDDLPDTEADAVVKFTKHEPYSYSDWYKLLLPFQGNMEMLYQFMQVNNGIGYMVDGEEFLNENLQPLEYAYIINLDSGSLEYWSIYGIGYPEEDNEVYSCHLLAEFSLKDLYHGKLSVDFCAKTMNNVIDSSVARRQLLRRTGL